jgi:hypothetical protein
LSGVLTSSSTPEAYVLRFPVFAVRPCTGERSQASTTRHLATPCDPLWPRLNAAARQRLQRRGHCARRRVRRAPQQARAPPRRQRERGDGERLHGRGDRAAQHTCVTRLAVCRRCTRLLSGCWCLLAAAQLNEQSVFRSRGSHRRLQFAMSQRLTALVTPSLRAPRLQTWSTESSSAPTIGSGTPPAAMGRPAPASWLL